MNISHRALSAAAVRLLGVMLVGISAAGTLILTACSAGETGSITLHWTPPTENEDGSDLDNLAGYRVYWRQAHGPIEQVVVIDDPASTTYEIEGLSNGEWRAGVTAFTEDALESDLATAAFTIARGKVSVNESTLGRIATRAEFHEAAGPVARVDSWAEDRRGEGE